MNVKREFTSKTRMIKVSDYEEGKVLGKVSKRIRKLEHKQ